MHVGIRNHKSLRTHTLWLRNVFMQSDDAGKGNFERSGSDCHIGVHINNSNLPAKDSLHSFLPVPYAERKEADGLTAKPHEVSFCHSN